MHHLYLSYQPDTNAFQKERDALESWCKKEAVEYNIITENFSERVSKPQIEKLLRPVHIGDIVIATHLTRLGRSIKMLMNVLQTIYCKGAEVFCLDTGTISKDILKSLELVENIDKQIRSERSMEGLQKAAHQGKQFGRPVGRKKIPEKNVLYGKTELIDKMIADGISKTEIAKRLDVSRGTIISYLKSTKEDNS
ncbi:MAG: recombinase family protein [Alistipes sp.]|nr:recombinase family protein [Candidatus Alistipes equi]